MAKNILKLGLVLCLICGISTLVLSTVNHITEPIIAELTVKQQNAARQEVLADAEEFIAVNEAFYIGKKGDATVGYAVGVAPSGYGGAIHMMVGISTEYRVTGIKIVSFSETPGLGSKAGEPKFLNQFIGKNEDITVVKGGANGDHQVTAVSGATVSSKAVTEGVKAAVALAKELGGADK